MTTKIKVPGLAGVIPLSPKLKKRQLIRIYKLYHSWVTYYLFDIVHKNFLIKSKGRADQFGVKWKPLSESRRIYKPLRRGEVSSGIRKKIQQKRVSKKEALSNRNPPINIDTGRLVKALEPGRVSSGSYNPPSKDQKVSITERGISLDIDIDYAEEVQAQRPYFPPSWTLALAIAVPKAIIQVKMKLRYDYRSNTYSL